MMLTLVIVGGICLLSVVVWLIRLNYASESLRTNGATALIVGLAGLLATLWFSLKAPEERKRGFPVVFVLNAATRIPLSFPEAPAAARYADPGTAATTAAFLPGLRERALALKPDDVEGVQVLYLDVLVRYVMAILELAFERSWDAEIVTFETAYMTSTTWGAREPLRPGSTVDSRALGKDLPRGLALYRPDDAAKFAVPPQTKVAWSTNEDLSRVLTMTNAFASLTVTVERDTYGVGSGGIAPLLGMSLDEDQRATCTLSYGMRLKATFERLRSGHPDMPAYVRWVDGLFAQFRRLDAEERWKKVKQDYVFLRDQQEWFQRHLHRAPEPLPEPPAPAKPE